MARCRSIKPGFMTNERLPELGAHAHLLYACLWMVADKAGRLEDRPKRIKLECMPAYDVDVDELLSQLAHGDDPFIQRYSVGPKRYIQIIKWRTHQSPHHTEKDSVIPEPPLDNGYLTSVEPDPHYQLPVTSKQQPETSNQKPEGSAEGKPRRRFEPPTVELVAAYCRERNNDVDPQKFVDFYTGKGWKIGKNAMVDWKAAVRTWEGNGSTTRAGPSNDPRNVKSSINEFLARGKTSGQP